MTDYTHSYDKNNKPQRKNQGYSAVPLTDWTLFSTTNNDIETASSSSSPQQQQQQAMKETFLQHHQDPSSLPIATSRPMMEVVAPADLPEGYEFEVQLDNNNKFKVQVPPGGIEQGQTFSVPYPEPKPTAAAAAAGSGNRTPAAVSIPVGHWRDNLFDCFQYGICHPHCWASWLCTFLATGQVIRRMELDWTGRPPTDTDSKRQVRHAFGIILALVVGYFVLHIGLSIVSQLLDPNAGHLMDNAWEEEELPRSYYWVNRLYNNIGWAYWVVSTIVLIRTRYSVRERYGIPGYAAKDVVCSICCHCCVAGQLLRHTTNYDVYPSVIFTDTGLPPHVPAIV